MAKYILAIDETGTFAINSKEYSFVCGVVVQEREEVMRKAYQKLYKEFGFPEPVPNSTDELLQNKENIEDKARFHFCKLSEEQVNIYKDNLLPFVKKVYISKDRPTMFANNQNWWQIAVTVVIETFLKDYHFEKDAEVEIWIDNRSDKVWGIIDETVDFYRYHDILKQQIKQKVQNRAKYRGIKTLEIKFKSDTSSFYINLADFVCGFVRKHKDVIDRDKIMETSCRTFTDNVDVNTMAKQYPLSALNCIFQEVLNNNCENVSWVGRLIKQLRKDKEEYVLAWDSFNEFLKLKIESRDTLAALVKAKQLIDVFLEEFRNTNPIQRLRVEQCLELATRFVEYYSHIGELSMPIDEKMFDSLLKTVDINSETRLLRRWEKKVSFVLRQSQIYFNGYDFEKFRPYIEECYNQHDKIIKAIELFNDGRANVKDEPTAALLGTLAQTYAYIGEINTAEEYFNLSKDYAIKSNSRTDSYLFCLHHIMGDVESCRKDFESVSGKTAQNYADSKDYSNLWILLIYCKLRALELHKNGETRLPHIDLQSLQSYNSEYPFPLIMKWEAIALWIEHRIENKAIVERYFSDSIKNLLSEENGFAIKTLSLPIIQCYGIVNNANEFHAKYNTLCEELTKVTECFKKYVDKSEVLGSIKNNCDIWQRALSLPFIYS